MPPPTKQSVIRGIIALKAKEAFIAPNETFYAGVESRLAKYITVALLDEVRSDLLQNLISAQTPTSKPKTKASPTPPEATAAPTPSPTEIPSSSTPAPATPTAPKTP